MLKPFVNLLSTLALKSVALLTRRQARTLLPCVSLSLWGYRKILKSPLGSSQDRRDQVMRFLLLSSRLTICSATRSGAGPPCDFLATTERLGAKSSRSEADINS